MNGFLSLRWRLIVPFVAMWALGLGILVAVFHASMLERFRGLVDQRADALVAAVSAAAESARGPADLGRFVSSLGATKDVAGVLLVAGSPPRVVAATDHRWLGRALDALPAPLPVAGLERVLASRLGERRLDEAQHRLDTLEPVLLLGSDPQYARLEDGVLLLSLDAASLWQAARETAAHLSLWLAAVMGLVAGLIYLLVSRYVLRPAEAIRQALDRRAEGDEALPVPVRYRDELGELAQAMNDMLASLQAKNLQLARARDQHLAMLESFPHLAWRAGLDGTCDWFNKAWLDFTGRSMAQEVGVGWLDGVHPEDRDACLARYTAAFTARQVFAMEYRLRTAGGGYHWIADHGAPIHDADGAFMGYVGSCYDLQPARDNAREIERMTRLYHALSATNKAIVHGADARDLLPQVCRIAVEFGKLDLAWIGFRDAQGRLVPAAAYAVEGIPPAPDGGLVCRLPVGLQPGGIVVNDVATSGFAQLCRGCLSIEPAGALALFPIAGAEGPESDGALVLRKSEKDFFDVHTVTLLQEMAADIGFALRNYRREEALGLAAKVFEHNSEGVVISDPDLKVVMINRAFTGLTGFGEEELRGRPVRLIDPRRHPRGFAAEVREVAAAGGVWKGEAWIRRAAGESFPADLSVSAVCTAEGRVTQFVGVFSDISQRKADEARIRFLADHDFLTGLPSRAALEPTLAAAIARAEQSGQGVALCFLDLDRFKNVNDTLGHHIGDQLLVEVARRLTEALGPDDRVLRHGGDEFVVVMPEPGDRASIRVAAERLLGALHEPFRLAGCEFSLSSSIGVAVYPDDGLDAESLLDRADMAMYRAKEDGRNAVEFFADSMNASSSARLSLEHDLRQALERGDLVLHFQPVVSAADGRLIGAEALLRWNHPELGSVPPAHFIPLAEESGLILPMGNWALDALCHQLTLWRLAGLRPVPVAANISTLQFRRADFVDSVAAALERHGVPGHLLTLEVTESMVMRDVERAARQLAELKALGLSIAIDDFGTGYSSLAYLKRFPLDRLKVDQSFVREINSAPEDRAIVAAIVGLGHNLGLELVAEGVESADMASTLRELGCDALQGWAYGRAEAAEVFAARLERSGATLTPCPVSPL